MYMYMYTCIDMYTCIEIPRGGGQVLADKKALIKKEPESCVGWRLQKGAHTQEVVTASEVFSSSSRTSNQLRKPRTSVCGGACSRSSGSGRRTSGHRHG